MFTKEHQATSPSLASATTRSVGLGIDLTGNSRHHQRVIVNGHYADNICFSHTALDSSRLRSFDIDLMVEGLGGSLFSTSSDSSRMFIYNHLWETLKRAISDYYIRVLRCASLSTTVL